MKIRERLKCVALPAVCALVGMLIAVLPHLQAWGKTGDPAWIADNDEVFYLQVGSQAYFNHPSRLGDPARAEAGHSIYKPLPLVPGVLIARTLGLGPIGIGPAWRIWAGLTIGLAWYFLFKAFCKSPGAVLALTLIFLADGGILEGRPLARQATGALKIMSGDASIFASKPFLHPQWRISTPGVTMAYLILLIWAVRRLRENPSKGRILIAGIAYGLLFHVYFYYWTAATIALGLVFLLEPDRRKGYFLAGVVGICVAAPSLLADVATKRTTAPDWLLRSDKFLPIGHFSELQIPWVAILLLLLLAPLVLRWRRDLLFVWCLCVAAIGLMNHQIISGLQIENFHWVYVWGPALSLLISLAAAGWLQGRTTRLQAVRAGVVGLTLIVLASGFALRWLEADRSRDCVMLTQRYHSFRNWAATSGWASSDAKPKENATVAGSPELVDFAVILGNFRPLYGYSVTLSSSVTNTEWDERKAINALLLGVDRGAFERSERHELETEPWGPWGRGRDERLRTERLLHRLAAYDRFSGSINDRLDALNVRYFITDPAREPGAGDDWRKVAGFHARGVD